MGQMSKPVLFILSMIFAQTLRVFRERKPAATPHQVRGRLFRIMLAYNPALHESDLLLCRPCFFGE
jgi:hypothetical protein